MRIRKTIIAAVLAAALAAGLAGCGGTGSSSQTGSSENTVKEETTATREAADPADDKAAETDQAAESTDPAATDADAAKTDAPADGTEDTTEAESDTGEADETESADAPSDPNVIPQGDGIVPEAKVQKAFVWLEQVAKDPFHKTYGDLAAYFGTDGFFEKEEYSEHMQVNKRYYKWISEDDDTHFLYVNFEEDEPGVYTISSYNSSGFTGSMAAEAYLAEVQEEARTEEIATAAKMDFQDFSVTLQLRGSEGDDVTLTMQIPESGWAYDEAKKHLVDSEDIYLFGAGFIQFKLEDDVADFDFYKDSFENYQDIEPRTIGGVEMAGRTYTNIGYDWTEYIAQLDDTHAISIGIVRRDLAEGTIADRILDSMEIE